MATGRTGRRAVVTGGAGAIGSVLVPRLLDAGAEVIVLDNLASGRLENLSGVQSHPKFRFVRADLRAAEGLPAILEGATEVWHLAANPDIRKGTEDPRIDLELGTIATFNVLQAARSTRVPRLYFSSSSVVYGVPTVFPTPEDYGPLLPQSQYAAGKLASEGLISAFANSYGFESVLFRFANIVGPGMTHGIIFDLFTKLRKDPTRLEVLGDGRQSKSYLSTDDCVSGMLFAAERARGPVSVYNLGSGDQITAGEIARRVVAAMGGKARIEFTGGERGWVGDVPNQLLATDRIRALGWRPRWNSAGAVDQAIALARKELGL